MHHRPDVYKRQVYLGAACGETVYVKKLFVSRPARALVRARAAQAALELALRLAQGKVPADTPVSYTHLGLSVQPHRRIKNKRFVH